MQAQRTLEVSTGRVIVVPAEAGCKTFEHHAAGAACLPIWRSLRTFLLLSISPPIPAPATQVRAASRFHPPLEVRR
jgi:hypothetical protein